MKKLMFIFGIVFAVLTVAGIVFIVYKEGNVSAGYAVVPMLFALVCFTFYRRKK